VTFNPQFIPVTVKILIAGLGNPILGDDGVGWRVAEEVRRHLSLGENTSIQVDIECFSLGGLSLMEHLTGYDYAILIDAITTGKHPQGSVLHFPLDSLPDQASGHLSSAHDTSLQTALKVGHSMGVKLPREVLIVAIETQNVYNFSEDLSPVVAEAIPIATQQVISMLISLLENGGYS